MEITLPTAPEMETHHQDLTMCYKYRQQVVTENLARIFATASVA